MISPTVGPMNPNFQVPVVVGPAAAAGPVVPATVGPHGELGRSILGLG